MANVLIPLAQDCEELEAVTMIDLLRRAQFNVVTAGLEPAVGAIRASRGTILVPDVILDKAINMQFDMIALPGGLPGADYLNEDDRIIALIRNMAKADKYTCAICAAPRVLAKAGVLEGKRVTSYPGTLDTVKIPGMTYVDEPVVVDGKVITSQGPGTAMDFALTLIEVLGGEALRRQVEEPLLRP